MSDVVIQVKDLSKQYRLGVYGTRTLSEDVNRWLAKLRGKEDPYLKVGDINKRDAKGGSDYVWALRDVNFEVKRGEVLGIVGRNGAGKSTLLKILSKVTGPTTGIVRSKGRTASLLEVGTGFHPELTGRENVFLNGAILGMTKNEIRQKFDEIVAFSGVEKYIDTPVKRYSSGMKVRLGFAVAAHLEPEILIVDEVLAVGDVEFQAKCLGKMEDVAEHGRTILFVSHNLNSVKKLCSRTIMMEDGTIKLSGPTNDVVDVYIDSFAEIQGENVTGEMDFIGSGRGAWISKARMLRADGTPAVRFSVDEPIQFEMYYEVAEAGIRFGVGVQICQSSTENRAFSVEDITYQPELMGGREPGKYVMKFTIDAGLLNEGKYFFKVFMVQRKGIKPEEYMTGFTFECYSKVNLPTSYRYYWQKGVVDTPIKAITERVGP